MRLRFQSLQWEAPPGDGYEMPNPYWADPIPLSLHGKLLRTAISSGVSAFQWSDASCGTCELWHLWAVAENCSSLMLWDKVRASLTFPIQCSLQSVRWMMPLVTICCSAETSHLGSVGCGLLHQNPSVCVGVSLAVQGGDAAGQVPDLYHWWVNLNCTPKQDPPCCSNWDQQTLSSDLKQLWFKLLWNTLAQAVSVLDYFKEK